MSAENGQNFVKNSDFQCLSVDGASAMNLPLHGIVPDFSDIPILDSNEVLALLFFLHLPTMTIIFSMSVCKLM